MSSIRLIISIATSSLLFILIYINIKALSSHHPGHHHDGGDGDHNAFLRILQQSVVSGGASADSSNNNNEAASEKLDSQDLDRLHVISGKLSGMEGFMDELKDKITRYNNSQSQQQQTASQTHHTKEGQHTHKSIKKTNMNILLLYADDWTHHTLSSYHATIPPNHILQTPTLDALSQDGIRFTHNCVTTSVCWISRATLFTGQYVSRHKTTEPCCWGGMDKPKEKLEEAPVDWRELSVYEILKREGGCLVEIVLYCVGTCAMCMLSSCYL
eukprot:scaffold101319_cov38-Cyclotella_meneghiniana.AAC.1